MNPSSIKDQFNRQTGIAASSAPPNASPALRALIERPDRNILFETTGHDKYGSYGLLAGQDTMNSLKTAGIQHVFIPYPTDLQQIANDLAAGELTKEQFVRAMCDTYTKAQTPGTVMMGAAEERAFHGQTADMILAARADGIQVHYADNRPKMTMQELGRLYPPECYRARSAAVTAYREALPADDPARTNQQALIAKLGDPKARQEFTDSINAHMQANDPAAYRTTQDIRQSLNGKDAQAMARFVQETAGPDRYTVIADSSYTAGPGDLDQALDGVTRVALYDTPAQAERDAAQNRNDPAAYRYVTQTGALTAQDAAAPQAAPAPDREPERVRPAAPLTPS